MTTRSTLCADLPPRISIDPGSRRTAITCSVGAEYLGGCLVRNDEPHTALGAFAIPVSYSYGYSERVEEAVALATIRPEFRGPAVEWWARRGVAIPDNVSPWIIAVEKVNLPNRRSGRPVTEVEALSVVAAITVGNVVWSHIPRTHRAEVVPWQADTSWEVRHGGTGRLADHYPHAIVAPVLRSGEYPDGIYPDGYLDRSEFRTTGIKDLAAAWAIGQAAAAMWTRVSEAMAARLVAPHETPSVGLELARRADLDLRARYRREGLTR